MQSDKLLVGYNYLATRRLVSDSDHGISQKVRLQPMSTEANAILQGCGTMNAGLDCPAFKCILTICRAVKWFVMPSLIQTGLTKQHILITLAGKLKSWQAQEQLMAPAW